VNAQDAYDALLTWCSEIGGGSIDAFRRACRHVGLSTAPTARVLSALGHVELDWSDGRFAAAPTTLTAVPGLPGRMLLTGARPYGLVAQLQGAVNEADVDADVAREPRHQHGRGPSTMFVDAHPADAAELCRLAGIRYTACAAEQISALLPEITIESATVAHRPDERFPHAPVDPHSFRTHWDRSAQSGPGLWTYRTWGGRRELILDDGEHEPRLVLDADAAPYLMSRPPDSDPIVEYRRVHQLLIVNAAAPLPALHARCATLCSGRVPIRRDVAPDVAYDHYVNVDAQVAERILWTLGATDGQRVG